MANIRSLNDISKSDESDDEHQSLYVGGSGPHGGGSSQSVLDPKKLMEKAKSDMGAMTPEEHARLAKEKAQQAFTGAGFRLNQTDTTSAAEAGDVKEDVKIHHKIVFWKDGFSVDDGPLRNPEDPQNQTFLNDVQHGKIPREFGNKPDTFVEMLDKSSENYKETLKAFKSFTGHGHSLGGPAASSGGPIQKPEEFTVDETQETTTLQIRLHDGTRLTQRFNTSNTIQDIRRFVATATPGCVFALMTAFPRAELSDDTLTIAAAQLQNAAITQVLR